ncbi:hypothetical protein A1Q2_04103 [Trichosporon asahii var. asahii CBS 8904]|uniref:Uncharacterized protein n=1 Tax=Trichosporon asahii var. asahii (strain CBS 8904) TaxID=1220162 RepID=K1VQ30_TRIAC|nr:hypothetical protein A1Q2_04103 [Trichosporon asahii var. asahii CBS 8904]
MLANLLAWLGGMATFAQVFLFLPMALDLLGPPSFLLLSLLFTLHHFGYSTLRLLCKNTLAAPLITILSVLSAFISGACVLTTLYYYLYPPSSGSTVGHALVNVLPYLYASTLRWVSPVFTLIEGICTLLVIQVVGRVGKGWADDDEKEEGFEWRALVGLLVASLVYCAGLYLVVWAFPSTPFPAFLLGAALAAVFFLSFIGFSLRRTNVLETSLVLFYVAYSAWLSAAERAMEPRTFGTGWLSHDWAVPKNVSAPNPVERLPLAPAAPPPFAHLPRNMRITTIVLGYRRAILIAVYTHLLRSQTWWRWVNIALFLSVWSLELLLDADEDSDTTVGRWKVE